MLTLHALLDALHIIIRGDVQLEAVLVHLALHLGPADHLHSCQKWSHSLFHRFGLFHV